MECPIQIPIPLSPCKSINLAIHHLSTLEVEVGQLRTVLYIDCTKLGVVSQIEINMIGDLAESVLFRNPSRGPAFYMLFNVVYISKTYILVLWIQSEYIWFFCKAECKEEKWKQKRKHWIWGDRVFDDDEDDDDDDDG